MLAKPTSDFRSCELPGLPMESRSEADVAMEAAARQLLRSHPHFNGRDKWIEISSRNGHLYLFGIVPSYYLKQMAQEAVRNIEHASGVTNEIVVASPIGESETVRRSR